MKTFLEGEEEKIEEKNEEKPETEEKVEIKEETPEVETDRSSQQLYPKLSEKDWWYHYK